MEQQPKPQRRNENSFEQNKFEQLAKDYDNIFPSHITLHYLNKRLNFIKSLIKQGAVLDVGCGTGLLASRLEEEGFSVRGLDSSQAMLEQMRKRGKGTPILGSSTALPFKSNRFDLVLSAGLLHHLKNKQEVTNTIKEMVRVVKPEGLVIIWDHNPNNPYWPLLMRRLPQDQGVTRLVPLREIVEVLKKINIKEIRIYRKGLVPDFTPKFLLSLMKGIEFICEKLPLVKYLAASNVIVASKNK